MLLLGELVLFSAAVAWDQARSSCASEIERSPGVAGPQAFVSFYDNPDLIAHLNKVAAQAGARPEGTNAIVVLPVYSRERLVFRAGGRILISTGLILGLRQEQELVEVLAAQLSVALRRRAHARAEPPSACGLLRSDYTTFEPLRAALEREIRQYEEWTRPRLKTR